MRRPRILMCPPDYFDIAYEINPWMDRGRGCDRAAAVAQWRQLVATLRDLGAQVEELKARPGLPDLVFTAGAGLIHGNRFYGARFRHNERTGESPVFDEWFTANGFELHHFPGGFCHEGAGDALFCGETLFAAYGNRSDIHAHQWTAKALGVRVLPVQLVNPSFFHLDTCFCPVAPDTAVWHPPAFDGYGQKVIAAHVKNLIEVGEEEARRFGCNAVVVGKTVVLNAGCPKLAGDLKARGYETREAPVDEFLKSGGGAKCLTLRLDGEEAAAWAATTSAPAPVPAGRPAAPARGPSPGR
jgi:N-dimethylarginine dimethylaminohydrolase